MNAASPRSTSQPTLRRAGAADAPAIRRMIQALILHSGNPPATPAPAEELARHMSGPHPDIEGVIAERGSKAVGMVLFFPWLSTWRGRLNLYIQDLYVEPTERGGGLGRRLLAAAAREGKKRGCKGLLLAVEISNADAARFYTRLGFQRIEEERHWLLAPAEFEALID
ncbi:MAG TPA: GNAT family N-acetyltransferase [Dongiaceae bacterium]|jgi:ribosomal protein S18 acetylase RimI-like enzyme|nr:GNAT family N-acetyltransferase [Dongiaceae bacterium]